jgi:hypothetical protein
MAKLRRRHPLNYDFITKVYIKTYLATIAIEAARCKYTDIDIGTCGGKLNNT